MRGSVYIDLSRDIICFKKPPRATGFSRGFLRSLQHPVASMLLGAKHIALLWDPTKRCNLCYVRDGREKPMDTVACPRGRNRQPHRWNPQPEFDTSDVAKFVSFFPQTTSVSLILRAYEIPGSPTVLEEPGTEMDPGHGIMRLDKVGRSTHRFLTRTNGTDAVHHLGVIKFAEQLKTELERDNEKPVICVVRVARYVSRRCWAGF